MSTPEELYQRAGVLLTEVPNFQRAGPLSAEDDLWLAKAVAIIEATTHSSGLTEDSEVKDAKTHAKVVVSYTQNVDFRAGAGTQLVSLLRRALARLELQVPTALQGAFVPTGDVYEAYRAVGDVLKTASKDILLVDPYADENILNAYAVLARENTLVRILTDPDKHKPTLKAARELWAKQYGDKRLLDVRMSNAPLHERLIILDGECAWTVTQSFKDLAVKHPTTIVRTPKEIADLKIKAYEDIWGDAFAMA